jgi:hypothetical protein
MIHKVTRVSSSLQLEINLQVATLGLLYPDMHMVGWERPDDPKAQDASYCDRFMWSLASSQPTMCLAGEELEQTCRVHCNPRHLHTHTHKYMQPNRSGKQRAGALHNEEDSELPSKFTSMCKRGEGGKTLSPWAPAQTASGPWMRPGLIDGPDLFRAAGRAWRARPGLGLGLGPTWEGGGARGVWATSHTRLRARFTLGMSRETGSWMLLYLTISLQTVSLGRSMWK